jgi:putative transposase
MVFHVLNRGVGRMRLFLKDADFQAFERIIEKTLQTCPMRICAYCLMSNHWHFVLWPERDGDLGAFMQKLTITHVRNWQENRHRVGYGHLYQSRYKSFPVESDEHFLSGDALSSSGTLCEPIWFGRRKRGAGRAFGDRFTAAGRIGDG